MLSRAHGNRDKEEDLRVPGPKQDTSSLFLLRGWNGGGELAIRRLEVG